MLESKRPTILVIDDDPVFLKLLARTLSSKGYDILSAVEAPVGLEIAMKQSPDLIILDVMMPIINGYNICRLLKSEQPTKHIPVVFLTGRTGDEDRRIGEEVKADAYIFKPLDLNILQETIRKLLKKS